MSALNSSFRSASFSGVVKCTGIALTISMLSGCSFIHNIIGSDSSSQPHTTQQATKKNSQIDTTAAAREAAEKYPKKVGQQVCRTLENKMWGQFIMVGKVGAIGKDYLMRVDLLRVQLKGHSDVTQRGFAKTRWALQNQWYSCKDPV